MAAVVSCTSPCVFYCTSCNFAFGGWSVTLIIGHGTMSRLKYGLINNSATMKDEGEDEALCCQKHPTINLW